MIGPAPDGTVIGPYRLLGQLGEGGMGIVYAAEQEAPVRRKVALKVLRPHLADSDLVTRFAAERQALAIMDHSGIARVYDAGTTADGRPYFAMELVSGRPLTEYADQHHLTLEARIRLFVRCCGAVHHAHQKGIIHRDLKPSNILVAEDQGRPYSKIIDFGIAKAVGLRLTEDTLLTRFGQAIGTPAYMSPEQADGTNFDIDTRTDVYSLGAILYELLVGCLPLDPRELGYSAFLASLQSRETESPTPGNRFNTLARNRQAEAARLRGTDPGRLRQHLSGDLGWVVMKALEKERSRRYDSAKALADDLEHYLAHEPVAARPPSTSYRIGKFIRRYRFGVAAAGLVLLTLIAGGVAAGIGFVRASREARTAREVSNFLTSIFYQSDPAVSRGAEVPVRVVLDSAATQIETRLSGQPLVQGRLMLAIGATYRSLNVLDKALPLLEGGLRRLEQGGAGALQVAEAQREYGYALIFVARWDSAEALLRQSWETRRRLLGDGDQATAQVLNDLVFAFLRSGEHVAEGDSLLRLALPAQRRILGPENESVALTMYHLSWALRSEGRLIASDSALTETLALRRRLYGGDHPQIAYTLLLLAQVQTDLGRLDSALAHGREVLAMNRRLYHGNHTETAYALETVARIMLRLGQPDSATPYAEAADTMLRQVVGSGNAERTSALVVLGDVLTDLRRFGPAEGAYRRAFAIDSGRFGLDAVRVVRDLAHQGAMQLAAARFGDATATEQRALDIAQRLQPEGLDRLTLTVLLEAGAAHDRAGDLAAARQLLRTALSVAERSPRDNPLELATAEIRLARVLTE
ncbi:MAG TPA: serine/threonine-protein kinase, partial [Gemmatimonadales bacterium]|nr:serine/threonine-protein kinase [Gemmatimonadales bacterium]